MNDHGPQPVRETGADVEDADAAAILVHGRGATTESMLQLSGNFDQERVAYRAPQAAGREWYPESFLAPVDQNEPSLSSALEKVDKVRQELEDEGVPRQKIVLIGFSQGACLVTEYAARNPERYGGVVALSGGLIGDELGEYEGDLERTQVLIGCSDRDPHIPVERVHETSEVFERLNADVEERIYEGMGHTINQDEKKYVSRLLSELVE